MGLSQAKASATFSGTGAVTITDEPFYCLDAELRFTWMNAAFEAELGLQRHAALARPIFEICPAFVGSCFDQPLRDVVQTRHGATLRGPSPCDPEAMIEARLFPVGEGVAVSYRDITETLRSERTARARMDELEAMYAQLVGQGEALRRSEDSLRAIFQASSEGLTFCRLIRDETGAAVDYQVLDTNPAHARLTGASRELMLSKTVLNIAPPVDPRWIRTAEDAIATRAPQGFEVYSRATGHWLDIRVSHVAADLFAQTFIDISDRKRVEDQRHTLLAEMNHRVKNNFQMVVSLLEMHGRRIADPAVRAELRSATRRVLVLAELHTGLSTQDDPRRIDFAAYLADLCRRLHASAEAPERVHVRLVEAEPTQISTETAVPLGFVVNEIVTNALKHAFPGDTQGEIAVSFLAAEGGHRLIVADNGCGLAPNPPTPGAGPGLGLRLIDAFIAQVGGRLTVDRSAGVRYDIWIPAEG